MHIHFQYPPSPYKEEEEDNSETPSLQRIFLDDIDHVSETPPHSRGNTPPARIPSPISSPHRV